MAGKTASKLGDYLPTQRIPVLYADGTPAMPTKVYRAKKLIKRKKAVFVKNEFGIPVIQIKHVINQRKSQPIVLGIDPGKNYTGMALQSAHNTLLGLHVKLPVKERKSHKRASRGIPNYIKENRLFELNLAFNLLQIYPISHFVLEISRSKRGKSTWNPTIRGEYWISKELGNVLETTTIDGVLTSRIRNSLKLIKQKKNKGEPRPETQVVDGIALAASQFQEGRKRGRYYSCKVTPAIFAVIGKGRKRKNSFPLTRKNMCLTTNIIKRVDYKSILIRN